MTWDVGKLWLTFSKFKATVIAPAPRRKSLAMATQSLPAIAMTDPPLWSIIDCRSTNEPYARNTGYKGQLTILNYLGRVRGDRSTGEKMGWA